MIRSTVFDEHFDQPALDPAVWTTSYLPAWSSRAAAAATYTVEDDGLHLTIPADHPLWVSAVQSGNWSGPVGTSRIDGHRAAVGSGIHPFRDPRLVEEFSAEPMGIDVTQPHRYAIDWQPGRVEFFVDDERTRVCAQAPDYPLQLILGVFDFPDRRPAGEAAVAELVVHRVHGTR
jgi:hypothetical protein